VAEGEGGWVGVISLTYVPFAHILMSMSKVQLWGYRCERCGHEWLPRKQEKGQPDPRVCPKCKSPYWNTPKREQRMPAFSEKKAAHVSKADV
jgi:ssDNA-binding Zn-finger/Zn-ribbon topoisomerase 1